MITLMFLYEEQSLQFEVKDSARINATPLDEKNLVPF